MTGSNTMDCEKGSKVLRAAGVVLNGAVWLVGKGAGVPSWIEAPRDTAVLVRSGPVEPNSSWLKGKGAMWGKGVEGFMLGGGNWRGVATLAGGTFEVLGGMDVEGAKEVIGCWPISVGTGAAMGKG